MAFVAFSIHYASEPLRYVYSSIQAGCLVSLSLLSIPTDIMHADSFTLHWKDLDNMRLHRLPILCLQMMDDAHQFHFKHCCPAFPSPIPINYLTYLGNFPSTNRQIHISWEIEISELSIRLQVTSCDGLNSSDWWLRPRRRGGEEVTTNPHLPLSPDIESERGRKVRWAWSQVRLPWCLFLLNLESKTRLRNQSQIISLIGSLAPSMPVSFYEIEWDTDRKMHRYGSAHRRKIWKSYSISKDAVIIANSDVSFLR